MPGANVSRTALERHAAFFDPDGTGFVTTKQTRAGLKRLGVTLYYRIVLPPIINFFLGYLTTKKFLSFTIIVPKIAEGMHPWDSGSFDGKGELDSTALDTLVAKGGGALTNDEMWALIVSRGNRRPQMGKIGDVLGKWFARREVRLFFCIAADTTKIMNGEAVPAVTERTLRRFYAGTLLHTIARRQRIRAAREARR